MTAATWPALPNSLRADAVGPDDAGYDRLRSTYMRAGSPQLVLRPTSDETLSAALGYVADVRREVDPATPFSIRSGGHGIAGSSTNDGGLVLDMGAFDGVRLLDPTTGLLRVGAGAIWGDVAAVLAPHDLALTTGNYGDTGVGGLATAGGVGYFARSQGLTIDHVRRVKLATADGRVRWVDAEHEPQLFWAVRGGASQAGVAMEFEISAPRLHSSTGDASIVFHQLQYLVDDLATFTAAWGEWIGGAPREAESFLMIQRAGSGQHVVDARTVWANDDGTAAMPTLRASEDLAQVLQSQAQIVPYAAIVPTPRSPHGGQQRIQMRDVLVDVADSAVGTAAAESLAHPATILAELRALGGAVADVPADATAWAGRHQQALAGTWTQPRPLAEVDASFAPLQALGTGMYGAYSSDTRLSAAELTWPGETGRRLRAVSESADPHRLFDAGLVLRRS